MPCSEQARPATTTGCAQGGRFFDLREAGHKVVATDLVHYDFGFPGASGRTDFLLERRAPAVVETIVTNAPFKLAKSIRASRR